MKIRKTKGFTLIEILVTIGIISILILPLSNMFLSTYKLNGKAEDLMIANQVAQQYMEQTKFNGVVSSTGSHTTSQIILDPNYHFCVVKTIQPYDTKSSNQSYELYKIQIEVYKEYDQKAFGKPLASLISLGKGSDMPK